MYRSRQLQRVSFALSCACLLLLASACLSDQGQHFSDVTHPGSSLQITPTSIQVQSRMNTPVGMKASPTPNASSVAAPGSGPIPAAFPRYFSFGVMSPPGGTAALDDMRSRNGAAFAFRYQYLAGGVNTNHGWETWNQPAGQFVTYYMLDSAQHSYIPTFVYYEICQSNGPHPGSYCGGHDMAQDIGNLVDPDTMNAYYANWVLLLQKIHAFVKPVLIIVEPDLWGFLQIASNGTDDATSIAASVSSSGFAKVGDFPNTAQGFAWALLHLRDMYAPNAILALHASPWSAGADVASDIRPSIDVAAIAHREANFLASAGLRGNPAGVSSWDLLSNDVADHDSAQPGGRSWWDRYNHTFPNFTRYLSYIGALSKDTHRRVIMWQVPMGNQYFDTMNNSPGHYQDNRAEYILGHVSSFASAGILAVLFGPGNGGTMNIDAMHDGITNPAPVSDYECDRCNTHVSSFSDDDGGYLRLFVGQYMRQPLQLS